MSAGTGLTARIRTSEGWPVPDAVLTVTDLSGRQVARAVADETGAVATEPLPPGTLTAVLTAVGYQPVARPAQISAAGAGRLGDVALQPTVGNVAVAPPGVWTIDPV
ncbi:carboxypeptidase-like regulatory domain-containing protein, partial [Nocardia brasiliensis]|uniref:carboxypeptidase-like regulatory domain-containing protein n=1 Tax=Nocardia brasiliensis TaxID=37326 RepID=UPI002455DE3C